MSNAENRETIGSLGLSAAKIDLANSNDSWRSECRIFDAQPRPTHAPHIDVIAAECLLGDGVKSKKHRN
jgi:hypothetical protein